MKRKTAKHKSLKKSPSKYSLFSYKIVFLASIIVILILGATANSQKENQAVLGESVYLAQAEPGIQPPQQAPANNGPQPQQQPQGQPENRQQQPQQGENRGSQPGQDQKRPENNQQMRGPENRPENRPEKRPENQQNSQRPNPGQNFQQKGPNDQNRQNNPDRKPKLPPITQQQNREFQQQFQQEANKNGFQIKGEVPERFLQKQAQGQPNPGNPNNKEQNPENSQFNNQNIASFQALPPSGEFPKIEGKFELRGTKAQNIDINDKDTRISFGGGPNSPFGAVRPDGTKVEFNRAEFEKLNSAIKLVTGSEITQKGDNFAMKRGDVEAQSKLPLSFNMADKLFTVQTKNGEQQVIKVLPDEAMQKLVESNVLSEVDTETAGTDGTEQASIELTERNNKPVYQVKGKSKQRFFGVFPVSISKTSVLSADSGELVATDQSIFSSILDTISF